MAFESRFTDATLIQLHRTEQFIFVGDLVYAMNQPITADMGQLISNHIFVSVSLLGAVHT
jgi:hypothetical protein